MWFAEKLGPLPGASTPPAKPGAAKKPGQAAKGAPAPQSQRASQPAPAAAPSEPKKKKGWF